MSYVDRDRRAAQWTTGVAAGLITAGLLAGLTAALNFKAIQKVYTDETTIDPTKQPPKPPPPPPPKNLPPPPKIMQVTVVKQPVVQVQVPNPPPPMAPPPPIVRPVYVAPPPTPAPPPPPPPPAFVDAVPRQELGFDAEDYPAAAERNNESGTSAMSFTVGTDGRVTNCTASGAGPTLDAAACPLAERRWRFKPATRGGQPVETHLSRRVRWVLPSAE